ncbi:class I SAM-dependent methyltransferase [Pseudoroseicyclus tamaricis]|uniref:Class I SAM-dependent methyltransferase n=1 Tax=Pseudoroseicyclus tamaricis TaxID=2705421 RepID=A0A6B2JXP0_9RHOB|nr:class I SAM-dependent methyltransferase [Pseudoroseicyclus tamaricis]NDV02625.1 class I SAM-dependent methyltransferase [Pseudoroseicyclus tamaricis]
MAHDPGRDDSKDAAARFAELTYANFRARAQDDSLSETEKLGSPDSFRDGFEPAILADFEAKIPALTREGTTIVDIGAGCGELARQMIRRTGERGQRLISVDSPEMLALLPEAEHVTRIAGRFPDESLAALREALPGGADGIVTYGVLQSVYFEANPFRFMDDAMSLLAPGGALLIGDVANHSKLRRFLASEAGAAFHRAYMRTDDAPVVPPFAGDPTRLDDGVLMGMMARARGAGFDAYLMPQPAALPVSNRREDLLILRP